MKEKERNRGKEGEKNSVEACCRTGFSGELVLGLRRKRRQKKQKRGSRK